MNSLYVFNNVYICVFTCKCVPFIHFYTLLHLAEVSNQLVDGHHRLMERTSDATPTDQPDDEHLVNQSSSLSENQLDDNQHPSDNGLEASQSILAGMCIYTYM